MSELCFSRVRRAASVLALGLAGWLASLPSHALVELTGISKIAAGGGHICALTTAGGVKCWGANANGQIGDNSTTDRLTPVDVSGLASGMAAIATGSNHACALTMAGGVKCWGANDSGQLGDNSTTQRLSPVDVSDLASGVAAIAAGQFHSCALTAAGGVKCWGSNASGQLGDNSGTQRLTPVDVSGLASGVAAIAAGYLHTCALTTAGGVKCWGANDGGQLGDNSGTQRLTPVDVSGLASGVAAIAAGRYHTCALTTVGGVKCWGSNFYGQLGDNSTTTRLAPVDVSGLPSGVTAITAAWYHTCALTTAGGVKCWGNNGVGQLGDNSTTQRLTPVDVSGLASGVTAITAGGSIIPPSFSGGPGILISHTCALTTAGGVKCWGGNFYGQLGDNSTTQRLTPVDVSGLAGGVAAITVGLWHTCALATAGGMKCWGNNFYGQLGDNSTTQRLTPVDVSGPASAAAAIAAGGNHTCALTTAGGVKCWGYNGSGQLGDNSTTQRLTPVDVPGLASGVAAIAAGGSHTCALTTVGGVKCWGSNFYGQLGDNSTTQRLTPVDVSGLGSGVAAIAAGGGHTCALTTAGGVKCWGYNFYGQLGDETLGDRLTPVDVSGLASGVAAIAAGGAHTCALTTAGGMKCWGDNYSGQLGDISLIYPSVRSSPFDVSGLTSGVAAITAGGFHTCALTTAGGVKCWGANESGQLGDNATIQRLTPVDVSGLASGVEAIAAGGYDTCALTTAGGVRCWGDNGYGQLGDSTAGIRPFPAPVLVPPSPPPRCALTASPSTIALGGSATLTATCDPAATFYAWTPAPDLVAGSANTATVTPTATGVYQYSVTGSNDGGAGNIASTSVTVTCSFSIPASQTVVANANTGTLNVTSSSSCAWTASSNADWITITSGSSGSGNGTVVYAVAANPGGSSRTGTLTVAGQTFTVTQAGLAVPSCTLTASPSTITAGQSSTLTATCSPAAVSYGWTNTGFVSTTSTGTVSPTVTTTYSVVGGNEAGSGNTASVTVTVVIPINGSCGSANGVTSATAPSSGLCSSGTPSAVTNDNPAQWTWTCAGTPGGTNASCAAPRMMVPTCTLTASPPSIPEGGTSTLTATCSPAATSYVWTNTGFAATASSGTVSPTVTTSYSVVGSNDAGSGNTASVTVTVTPTFNSQSDCLFDWAEENFPSFFAPAGAVSNILTPYYYRYYPQTNAYLGTSSADNHVYYLGPLSGNSIFDVGPLSPLLSTAGCQ